MIVHPDLLNFEKLDNLSQELMNETRSTLKGSERHNFMVKVIRLMGKGGQRRAERELEWDRKKITPP